MFKKGTKSTNSKAYSTGFGLYPDEHVVRSRRPAYERNGKERQHGWYQANCSKDDSNDRPVDGDDQAEG